MLVVRAVLQVGMKRGYWGPRGPGFWSLLVVFLLVSSWCVGQSLCSSGAACLDEAQRESELPFPDASRLVGLLTEGCDIHGDRVCCEELSSHSFSGAHGVSVNPVVGLAYLREACLLGSEPSCERWLGLLLEGGPGLSADPGTAVPELRTRCNGPPSQGWACYELGVLYAEGRGVAVDAELSGRLFSAACSAGDCRGEGYAEERAERERVERVERERERVEREALAAQERAAMLGAGFVYISPGTFTMGSPSTEEGRDDDETQHEVTLTRGFYLQATEVTLGEWQRVMGTNPSDFTFGETTWAVGIVSWLDAIGYANARSRLEGLSECYDSTGSVRGGGSVYDCTGYRLPTEAEWEYAARAGTTGLRYGGLDQVALYEGNSFLDREPVGGQLQANAWGLYDMLGNAWEWTHDWYADYPSNVTDPEGPSSGSRRILRGGSVVDLARDVRAANRSGNTPDFENSFIGFRLARSAP